MSTFPVKIISWGIVKEKILYGGEVHVTVIRLSCRVYQTIERVLVANNCAKISTPSYMSQEVWKFAFLGSSIF